MISRLFYYRLLLFLVVAGLSLPSVFADEKKVQLDATRDSIETVHNGQVIEVRRIQDLNHTIAGFFARTSHPCPPHCIEPIQIDPRVKTVGEREVFDFMSNDVINGSGVLIDARLPSWNKKGTIPGAVNIPFTVLESSSRDPALVDALYKLGVSKRGQVGMISRALEKMGFLNGDLKNDDWDFTQAKKLILFCNGPWCGQSPRAIKALLKLGYPADKLAYYRGGMQMWQLYGLTTIVP
ncbi:MAG TPA: rhodanese-like domain-containing protein [Gammaproteobacteria bacterium]|nr:rhodanese-like domain-containing protein [Gammaproteobacteria bacterium]